MRIFKGLLAVLSLWAAYGFFALGRSLNIIIDGYKVRGSMFDFLDNLLKYADQIAAKAMQPLVLIGLVSFILILLISLIVVIFKRTKSNKNSLLLMVLVIVIFAIFGGYVFINMELIEATINLLEVMDSVAIMRFGGKLDGVINIVKNLKLTLLSISVVYLLNALSIVTFDFKNKA